MSVFLSLALLTACEACDELARPGAAHPFAIDAAWRPKCDARAARFVEDDPWPKAGEIRRDVFTRDCAEVLLTRVFLDAGDGFAPGELFVGARIERKIGRGSTPIRQQEFLGASGGFSYRYHVTADGQKVLGSVEAAMMTSHLVSTVMAPAVRVKGGAQSVMCEVWRRRCEIMSRRVGEDVVLPFFTIAFDEAHPGGLLCIDASDGVAVTLRADAEVVVDGATAPAGSASTCLGERSERAIEALTRAQAISYRAQGGAASSEAALEAQGLGQAVALGRFLLGAAALSDARAKRAEKLHDEAEVLLDGAGVPN